MTTIHPTLDTFQSHHNAQKTQLVWTRLPGDLETAVSAYLKLCGDSEHSFLLESIEGGATLGRYSIIGFDPDVVLKDVTLDTLRTHLSDCRIDIIPDNLPPMAVSGLFGYLGYDVIRLIENIPDQNTDDLNIPDSILVRPRTLVIFDNVYNEIFIITPVYDTTDTAQVAYQNACDILTRTTKKLAAPLPRNAEKSATNTDISINITSNTTKDRFLEMVAKAKGYIFNGDIFQTVLSQRFSCDFPLPAFSLYRALRTLNPSPFMVHMNFGEFSIVASSPEIMVRVRDNTVTIRPIAGTRPRGQTPAEDAALAGDLLGDEKECAEHLMLLDLGRNDVGRVADFGTLKVTDQFTIEKYSHVMHIVSNVEGQLRDDLDIIDAHFAGFPAGTVSGAPKVRAMKIIDELETERRRFYAGSMGYFSGNGAMDTCIALRTALIKDKKLYVQAGAGIVADSDPDSEYQETVNKAQALFKAAEMALERFG